MKKYIISLVCILTIIGFQSCSEDFLEQGLLGEVEETNFMQNQNDAILATNAIYNTLRNWRYHGGYPVLDILSDDAAKGSNPSDAIQIQAFEEFSYTPSQELISGFYSTLYVMVRRTNLVIERAPEIEMDEALKNRLIAEARFFRGLTYFKFVQLYGGVPIVTTTDPERLLPRNSIDEVYDFLIQDFLFAIDNLPEKSDYPLADLGRATKGAAKGFLAKVYLFRKDFVNAEKYALEVINSGEYSLDPSFEHTFSKDGEFGPGSIYEIAAAPGNFQDGGHQYGNTQGVRSGPNRGWGFNRPTYDLMQSFESGDPRMESTIIRLGEEIDGIVIGGDGSTPDTVYDANGNIKELEVYNQKVWTPGTGPLESWDHNVRLLRLADILLVAAEALNENGKPAEALPYINQVRARARGGNPDVLPDITETNQQALRMLILRERRSELALEQHRFLDLVRTGNAPAILGPLGFVEGKHELFPIPQSDIDLSEGLLSQNPNW